MSKENPGSKTESGDCKFCKQVTSELLKQVIVGENRITFVDDYVCQSCKLAYDRGYQDGLNDSNE